MLVLSRKPGNSIYVGGSKEQCVITLLNLLPERGAVSILINRAFVEAPGQLDCRHHELQRDRPLKISRDIEVSLVQIRDTDARLGIAAPREFLVHRLEVYEEMRTQNRMRRGDDSDDGGAGSRIPRPDTPKPPSLDIRLDEPREPDNEK